MLECSPSRRTADCGRALPQSALVSISAGQLSWLTAEVLMAHRAIGSGLLRNVVNPAQTPRYYRTVSSPVSSRWRHQVSAFWLIADGVIGTVEEYARPSLLRTNDSLDQVPDRGDVAVGAHAGDHGIYHG